MNSQLLPKKFTSTAFHPMLKWILYHSFCNICIISVVCSSSWMGRSQPVSGWSSHYMSLVNVILHTISQIILHRTEQWHLLPLSSAIIFAEIPSEIDIFHNSKLFQPIEKWHEYFQCYAINVHKMIKLKCKPIFGHVEQHGHVCIGMWYANFSLLSQRNFLTWNVFKIAT